MDRDALTRAIDTDDWQPTPPPHDHEWVLTEARSYQHRVTKTYRCKACGTYTTMQGAHLTTSDRPA